MQIMVNQQTYKVAEHPERPLVWLLRDELGLPGTNIGCGIGQSGTSTVLIDGAPANSCQTPLSSVQGKQVFMIEGLGETGPSGEVQLTFVLADAALAAKCKIHSVSQIHVMN